MAPGAGKRKSKSAKVEQQGSSTGPAAAPPGAGTRVTAAAAAAVPGAMLLPPAPLQLGGAASLPGVAPAFAGLDPGMAAFGIPPVSCRDACRAEGGSAWPACNSGPAGKPFVVSPAFTCNATHALDAGWHRSQWRPLCSAPPTRPHLPCTTP